MSIVNTSKVHIIFRLAMVSTVFWGMSAHATAVKCADVLLQEKALKPLSVGIPESVVVKINQELAALKEKHFVPGLSVSFLAENPAAKTFSAEIVQGTRSFGKSIPVSTSTIVPLGSVSKLYTTLAVLKLLDKGQLTLDAPLSSYHKADFVAALRAQAPEKMSLLDSMTIRHLLSHQSGLMQDMPGTNMWWDPRALASGKLTSVAQYNSKMHELSLLFPPGEIPTGMKYSNISFDLLAQLVRSYGGHPSFEGFVTQEIINPLGLKNTVYFVDPTKQEVSAIHGNRGAVLGQPADYRLTLPMITEARANAGSIGVSASAKDMSLFGREILRLIADPRYPDVLQIRSRLFEAIQPASKSSGKSSWGLGFNIVNIDGYIGIGHTGTHFGSRSIMFVFPELNFVFSAHFNSRDVVREDFLRATMKTLLDEGQLQRVALDPKLQKLFDDIRLFQQNTNFPVAEKPVLVDVKDVPENFKALAGNYQSPITGAQAVGFSTKGKLVFWGKELTQDAKDPDIFYFPSHTDAYSSAEPVKFIRDQKGAVIGIHALYVLFIPKVTNIDQSPVTDFSAWDRFMDKH